MLKTISFIFNNFICPVKTVVDPYTALTVFSTVLSFAGGLRGSSSAKRAARRAKERGIEQNMYNKMAAKTVEVSGQISALDALRQAKLMASRAVAVAAAGGYSDDITNLIADIDGEGAYKASVALYEAGSEAERLRHEGRMAEKYGIEQSQVYRGRAKNTTLAAYGSLATNIGEIYA